MDTNISNKSASEYENTSEYVASRQETEEERIERSWDFLTIITEQVERMPKETQDRILEAGRGMINMSYNHDTKKPRKPRQSAAKIAAQQAALKDSKNSKS